MVLVPDKTRKLALAEIDFVDKALADVFADAVAAKRVVAPLWTDESASDLGMQLLSVFSSLTWLMLQAINLKAWDCFLATASDRQALRYLARQIGYDVLESAAATVTVTFTFPGSHAALVIPARTRIATQAADSADVVIFEAIADVAVAANVTTAEVPCIQGETVSNEIIGSSDGAPDQKFYLRRRPVVWASETIEVHDGDTWVAWTRQTDLVESDADDKHYTLETDNQGYVYVCFGDGVFGKTPEPGTNNVRATYRIGGGARGNVAAITVTELLSAVDSADTVSNALPATGGADAETITHARRAALALWRTRETLLRTADVENILRRFVSSTHGAIAQATAVVTDSLTLSVRFVPATGGNPAQGFKDEVKTYLDPLKAVVREISVENPDYLATAYNVTIYVQDGYLREQVIEQARQAIVRFGSPIYRDSDGEYPNKFGATIALSRLYRELHAVPGIDRATITTPATDLTMPAYQIRSITSISITAYQGGTSVTRPNLSTEL